MTNAMQVEKNLDGIVRKELLHDMLHMLTYDDALDAAIETLTSGFDVKRESREYCIVETVVMGEITMTIVRSRSMKLCSVEISDADGNTIHML